MKIRVCVYIHICTLFNHVPICNLSSHAPQAYSKSAGGHLFFVSGPSCSENGPLPVSKSEQAETP